MVKSNRNGQAATLSPEQLDAIAEELPPAKRTHSSVLRPCVDGGLASPDKRWWSLGGFGLWWPGEKASEEFDNTFKQTEYIKIKVKDDGIGMFAKAEGQRNSSTRMEIAGAIIAINDCMGTSTATRKWINT